MGVKLHICEKVAANQIKVAVLIQYADCTVCSFTQKAAFVECVFFFFKPPPIQHPFHFSLVSFQIQIYTSFC